MDIRSYCQTHSQTLLARKLGVTPGLVSQWITGRTVITAERAAQIELSTNGAVTRAELRPDIFGPLDEIRDRGAT
ncbi:helix-turn-helix domain-containing protein [Acidithiobacillus ferrooxidans]|nr:helix-turn-helix domain-containing protein [Acidithiobacillus ferrooxidans]